jgi:hypothetical protein
MVDIPQITVYHPTEKGSVSFANIGYPGLIGILTGFSAASIGISEKLWMPSEEQKATTTRFGQPWMYVLRDTLQFSKNLKEAIDHLSNAKRTCS